MRFTQLLSQVKRHVLDTTEKEKLWMCIEYLRKAQLIFNNLLLFVAMCMFHQGFLHEQYAHCFRLLRLETNNHILFPSQDIYNEENHRNTSTNCSHWHFYKKKKKVTKPHPTYNHQDQSQVTVHELQREIASVANFKEILRQKRYNCRYPPMDFSRLSTMTEKVRHYHTKRNHVTIYECSEHTTEEWYQMNWHTRAVRNQNTKIYLGLLRARTTSQNWTIRTVEHQNHFHPLVLSQTSFQHPTEERVLSLFWCSCLFPAWCCHFLASCDFETNIFPMFHRTLCDPK